MEEITREKIAKYTVEFNKLMYRKFIIQNETQPIFDDIISDIYHKPTITILKDLQRNVADMDICKSCFIPAVIYFTDVAEKNKSTGKLAVVFAEVVDATRLVPKIKVRLGLIGTYFNSMDGEFHKRFIDIEYVYGVLSKVFPEIYNILETIQMHRMDHNELEFQTKVYLPEDSPVNSDDVRFTISRNNIESKIFRILWFLDYFNYSYQIVENHVDVIYGWFIFKGFEDKVFTSLINDITEEKYIFITNILENNSQRSHDNIKTLLNSPYGENAVYNMSFRVGCKLFTMSNRDLVSRNIKSSVFLEEYLNKKAELLVINGISYGFPTIIGSAFLKNIDRSLFSSRSVMEKYKMNDEALNQEKDMLHAYKSLFNVDESMKQKQLKFEKFNKITPQLMSAIEYNRETCILTNVAMAILIEYTGRTFADIPKLFGYCLRYPALNNYKYIEKICTKVDYFAKILFDISYNLYCLNDRFGVIHGDLHLNNCTIKQNIQKFKLYDYTFIDDTCYMFENPECSGNIIDFSRSLVGNRNVLLEDFDADIVDDFLFEQSEKVITYIIRNFPEYKEQLIKIKDIIKPSKFENHKDIFEIVSICDIYSFVSGMHNMFDTNNYFNTDKNPSGEALEILKYLKETKEKLKNTFKDNFDKLLANTYVSKGYLTGIFIKENFAKYSLNKSGDGYVQDGKPIDLLKHIGRNVASFNNKLYFKMQYDEKSEYTPDILNPQVIADLQRKHKLGAVFTKKELREENKKISERETQNTLELEMLLDEYAKKEYPDWIFY